MEYKPTIGLEIHAELKTRTKMFCDSKNDPNETTPNVNICPVCMAHPGALPVINKAAVRHVLRVGLAIGGTLADFTEWDRKNYFYPDLPKGYQISQYQYPLISGGSLADVAITRIHLEEDTARSTHDNGPYSLVDFNRAGVPLMELVTEPVVKDATQAVRFARELQLILRTLGAGDANMEKGEMRVEANISISKTDTFGTKVEVKNLNSFKAVDRAITYEIERQSRLLNEGGTVVQETRGWDEEKQQTFSQRMKEDSHDYRYFPEPDLPKLKLSEVPELTREELLKDLPELPKDKRVRYKEEYDIKESDVEILVVNPVFSTLFESAMDEGDLGKESAQIAANYITSDLVGVMKNNESDTIQFPGKAFATLITRMAIEGGDPAVIAEKYNLLQQSDQDELLKVVERIINNNEKIVAEYKAGKESALKYFVGQGMKETNGSANPQLLQQLFEKKLSL
jgi:aspartyl-tRNA(Asn)/glutamyl-tRNA(Gln) amidotransferase subunit B